MPTGVWSVGNPSDTTPLSWIEGQESIAGFREKRHDTMVEQS